MNYKTIKGKTRPIVIITSNNEKELPDAFLRRCFFITSVFPERPTMIDIINVHFPHLEEELMEEALKVFMVSAIFTASKRNHRLLELIDWIRLLKTGKNTKEDLQK